MSDPTHCVMTSGHGEVMFDVTTGDVVLVEEYEDTEEPGCLKCITKVDVVRLRELIPDFESRGSVDILDVGHWLTDENGQTVYEPPCEKHSAWTAGKREFPW
jgi:hypothetical protein